MQMEQLQIMGTVSPRGIGCFGAGCYFVKWVTTVFMVEFMFELLFYFLCYCLKLFLLFIQNSFCCLDKLQHQIFQTFVTCIHFIFFFYILMLWRPTRNIEMYTYLKEINIHYKVIETFDRMELKTKNGQTNKE